MRTVTSPSHQRYRSCNSLVLWHTRSCTVRSISIRALLLLAFDYTKGILRSKQQQARYRQTMASAVTMSRPQPPGRNNQKPPPPPPPRRRPPPPPPPPRNNNKGPPKPPTQQSTNTTAAVGSSSSLAKRSAPASAAISQQPKRSRKTAVSIQAPVVLRDVNVFLKKHQVGQGTYGYVFIRSADIFVASFVCLMRTARARIVELTY